MNMQVRFRFYRHVPHCIRVALYLFEAVSETYFYKIIQVAANFLDGQHGLHVKYQFGALAALKDGLLSGSGLPGGQPLKRAMASSVAPQGCGTRQGFGEVIFVGVA